MSLGESKNFFDYTDFRELLKALFEQNKVKNKNFSYRYFSKRAGFVAHSFLKFVIDGKSALSDDSVEKIIKGFKMNQEEGHFFRHLVHFNQATSVQQKQIHAKEILRSKAYKRSHPLGEAQYNFYAHWYFIPVREMVALPGFKEDYGWIADVVIPAITPDQAKKAVKELLELGLLNRDVDGKLSQSSRFLATPDEVSSSSIAQWHLEMMKRAGESIDTVSRDERDISSVTLRLSKENLKKAKTLISQFRKDLVETLSTDVSDAVYELNLHLFPLTSFLGGRK